MKSTAIRHLHTSRPQTSTDQKMYGYLKLNLAERVGDYRTPSQVLAYHYKTRKLAIADIAIVAVLCVDQA